MRSFQTLITLIAVCADAMSGAYTDKAKVLEFFNSKRHRAADAVELPSSCMYEGRWFGEGEPVVTREACLRCVCGKGALSCTRRACSRLPDPPPKRCHVVHRKGACCPELHCPDGVILMEQAASARFETESFEDIIASNSMANVLPACVEGGTVYSAGSAMSSGVACEQCFCLGGGRRCTRPTCLPPPAHCAPRPAPGACCPQRYYCRPPASDPSQRRHQHDCLINNRWLMEGDRVISAERMMNCTECFCLRGEVQCQRQACAKPLMGCEPLLRPGDCCPHRYHCVHEQSPKLSNYQAAFNLNTRAPELETQVYGSHKKISRNDITARNSLSGKNAPFLLTSNQLVSTTKVKRRTSDSSSKFTASVNSTTRVTPKTGITDINSSLATKVSHKLTTAKVATKSLTSKMASKTTTKEEETTTDMSTEEITEQPEGSMRITINGTINCTSELSSTSIPINASFNEAERIKMESRPRIPLIDTSDLGVTFSPNDIITDRSVNSFDENETFTINVTSSLVTNNSLTTKRPAATAVASKTVATGLTETTNSSKKTKGDYDYDYTEPTLPPSLPNLKIIPFVAADAVVEDEVTKAEMAYPILDRNDKFPVYYPNAEPKDTVYAKRKEDVYNPTQYPVFMSDKEVHYPAVEHDMSKFSSNVGHEFTVPSSYGGKLPDVNRMTKSTTNAFELETPAVNLFSPPQETEGGFVPKDPGSIDSYYAVFSSTPPSPGLPVPHLTTSMQLDMDKGDCILNDGRRVAEDELVVVACKECRCLWGELRCMPKICPTTVQCSIPMSKDPCCPEVVCKQDNRTLQTIKTTTEKSLPLINNITKATDPPKTNAPPVKITKNTSKLNSNEKNVSYTNKPVAVTFESNKIATVTDKTTLSTTSQTNPVNSSSVNFDEDDEEEFSFGSVLKLLLSDSYQTTTIAPTTRPSATTKPTMKMSTTKPTRKPLPTLVPFIPLPPYSPLKRPTVNRIDHLILGDSSAITTSTAASTTLTTTKAVRTTPKPVTEGTVKENSYFDTTKASSNVPAAVPGLLKLAGCNIYGRMYRVGRIITELSSPCQECWCTELGVQCKQLKC